ncbi:hypothetical protein M422DRAFT_26050 [Sphaerobolus stellatus SS14]|nr:hypothetical protein M422DRAFT_26050 [Sphaerobolus stellatus SS14]
MSTHPPKNGKSHLQKSSQLVENSLTASDDLVENPGPAVFLDRPILVEQILGSPVSPHTYPLRSNSTGDIGGQVATGSACKADTENVTHNASISTMLSLVDQLIRCTETLRTSPLYTAPTFQPAAGSAGILHSDAHIYGSSYPTNMEMQGVSNIVMRADSSRPALQRISSFEEQQDRNFESRMQLDTHLHSMTEPGLSGSLDMSSIDSCHTTTPDVAPSERIFSLSLGQKFPQRSDVKDECGSYPLTGLNDPFSKVSPSCLDGRIKDKSTKPEAGGGFSDVWKGYLDSDPKRPVAIKTLRLRGRNISTPQTNEKIRKRIWREYLPWSSVEHPNINTCLGFTYDFTGMFMSDAKIPALISQWMPAGTLTDYIFVHPDVDRAPFILGLTEAVKYLHTRVNPIIHGDIRAGNILISPDGVAKLTDFGLSRILESERGLTTSSGAGSLCWKAPELFGSGVKVTKATDVWAYAMTILEIATGKAPYSELEIHRVPVEVFKGCLPQRPKKETAPLMSDPLWCICMGCWTYNDTGRPSIDRIAPWMSFALQNA